MSCRSKFKDVKLEFLSPDVLDRLHKEIWRHCNSTYMLSWMSEDVKDPCSILQPVLTGQGVCQTFNGLPNNLIYRSSVYPFPHENNYKLKSSNAGQSWSPDRGYPSRLPSESPPWRLPGGGFGQDATFILNLDIQDFDDACFFGGHGFFVHFHSPAELPGIEKPTIYVHTDHLAMVKIIPDIKVTDKILKRWTPLERGCFFEDERELKYFNIYTEKNCDTECEVNMSVAMCGCVPFSRPRTKDIPICGPLKQQCYLDSTSKSFDPLATSCNCLPSCFEIEYKIDVTNFRRNWSIAGGKGFKFDIFEKLYEENFAVLTVQYQTQKVTAMKRIAVFGLSDFIANIGGLLGLFLGFSFLSLFEVFYFCALRFNKSHQVKISAAPEKRKGLH